MTITVKNTGEVVVTIPQFTPAYFANKFVEQKQSWIEATQSKLKHQFENKIILKHSKKDFLENKTKALKLITERVMYFNMFYNFTFKDIKVKQQATRWGSCSSKGNLNFNYSLVFLPPHLRDYIVVHELCHLKEFNHGRGFWNLVARTVPDYKDLRNELKKNYIHVQ